MNIFKQIEYNRNSSNIVIKVDVRKHLPLYILMNNINTICYYSYIDKPKTQNDSTLLDFHKYIRVKYPTITYNQFLQDPIFNINVVFNRDGIVFKRDIKKLLFYRSLKSLNRQGSYITGLGSLIGHLTNPYDHIFSLCVKKGYEKYVQLCLLLNQEFEFDCLYFIYNKNTLLKHPRHIERVLLKEMLLYCKNYTIDTLEVEDVNINRELEHDFKAEFSKLTNIKSLKDKLQNIHSKVIENGL